MAGRNQERFWEKVAFELYPEEWFCFDSGDGERSSKDLLELALNLVVRSQALNSKCLCGEKTLLCEINRCIR